MFSVKDPERLVLDLEGVEFGPALVELNNKVATGDPYIDKLRVGRNRPGRGAPGARPQDRGEVAGVHAQADRRVRPPAGARSLSPWWRPIRSRRSSKRTVSCRAGKKRSRPGEPPRPEKPKVARMATIVLDPGHGGEDPGCARPARFAGEGHHADHRHASEGDDRRRARHARGADARRGLLRPAADARGTRRAASRPTCSSRCMPTPSSSRMRAARACSRSRRGAPLRRQRAGWRKRRTKPT